MKIFTGALVGGIIVFIWQFLVWTILNIHKPAQSYTPNQDKILSALSENLTDEGGYLLPSVPEGTSMDEEQKQMEAAMGKPWAIISYHKSQDANMVKNIALELLSDIVIVYLFCFIISGITRDSFGKVFLAALFTGLIIFLNSAYTFNIWFKTFDLSASFVEYMVQWLLVGIWLGWWLNRKKSYAK